MPNLETYRKQTELLLRWHRERDYSIGEKIRRLERYATFTDREALALDFTPALAQEIVAAESGFSGWAALEAATESGTETPRPAPEPSKIQDVLPILLVRDVTATASFFERKLGFNIDFLHGLPPFYGSISRDGVRLHLRFVHQPSFAAKAAEEESLLCASFEVTNIEGLYAEFEERGLEFAQPLTEQAWGGTDFHVRDLDGNVIAFVTYAS